MRPIETPADWSRPVHQSTEPPAYLKDHAETYAADPWAAALEWFRA